MVGIEELKKVISAASLAVSALDQVRTVDFGKLKAEALDLDMSEKAELSELFNQSFNLQNDSMEENIEKGFEILLTLGVFLGKIA